MTKFPLFEQIISLSNHNYLKDITSKNPKKPVRYPSYWAQGFKNDIERESIRIKFYVLQRVNAQDK